MSSDGADRIEPQPDQAWKALGLVNEWVRHAETKVAATLAATGVTAGALLNGVRLFGQGSRTHTLAMTASTRQVSFVDTVHMSNDPGPRGVRLY